MSRPAQPLAPRRQRQQLQRRRSPQSPALPMPPLPLLRALALALALLLLPRAAHARNPAAMATTLAEHVAAMSAPASTCRGLLDRYTDYHRAVRAGQAPQRYLVFSSPPSGIADRMIGLMGAFLFAVLTRRAILIEPFPMPYELLYDQPFINWTTPALAEDVAAPVRWPPRQRTCACGQGAAPHGVGSFSACAVCQEADGRTVAYMNFINQQHTRHWHTVTNLSNVYADVHTVHYSSNRGVSVGLFHNLAHERELYGMGLRPSTAFGCAFNYLFFPRPETLAVVADELAALRAADLVIGVQIRTDDKYMEGRDMDESFADTTYRPWLACAESLERVLGVPSPGAVLPPDAPGVRSRWLVVSDSSVVRRQADKWYGGKLIMYMRSRPTHVITSGTSNMEGSRLAAAEHWLLGMTDYQVISWWSGYGRTAAMRAMRELSVAPIRSGPTPCGLENLESSWQLGEGYSGVRRSSSRRQQR